MLSETQIGDLAQSLDECLLNARERERLTLTQSFTLAEAYQIQDEGMRRRYVRGERFVGYKMGLTSKAKMDQMGLHLPIYGVLTDRMEVPADASFARQGTIHPRIEPEIAFRIGRKLRGVVSSGEALAACSGVMAAMEILDSRFLNFKYFSLEDVVADNCSSSHFVLGKEVIDPRELDVGDLMMTMRINGKEVQSARSSAILGHPLQSLVKLCEILASRGLSLPAGSIVLTGAATQAVPLEPGDRIETEVESLGRVALSCAAA